MTHAAIGELSGVDVIAHFEVAPDRELIGWRKPVHVKNLLVGPKESFRLAMAIETPLHVERVFLPHEGHLIHRSVTRGAANAFVHVLSLIHI